LLAASGPGTQEIQADPRHDSGQPGPHILNVSGIGAAQPQPGLLDGIIRFGQRAKHPVRHAAQVTSILFESLRKPVLFVHTRYPMQ
jgi:hypothetical protein